MTATIHHPSTRPTSDRRNRPLRADDLRRRRQSRRPNYPLRRLGVSVCAVSVLALAAQVAAGAVGALAGLDSRPAAASEAVPAAGDMLLRSVHVAEPGDTLWSIADRYRGEVDRGRFVDRLIDLNGGTSIQAGQAVRLP